MSYASVVSRRTIVVAGLASLLAAAPARANGRFPASIDVGFQPGNSQKIFVAVTFGMVISEDDGATWRWTCENNIGYTGLYDPKIAVSSVGTIVSTTPNGLAVSRDGACDFAIAPAPIGPQAIADVTIGADGAIWAVTNATSAANHVYVSHDDGMTFADTGLTTATGVFTGVRVAPSDPQRVYVTGRVTSPPAPLLFRSDDGGGTWQPIPFDFMGEPKLAVKAVAPDNPDVVFVDVETGTGANILRSETGAMSFTPVLHMNTMIFAFVVRADALDVIAGTIHSGVKISHDGGMTWSDPATQLMMACGAEREDGTLFGCGANWAPDDMALGRSTDGEHWTKAFRFSEPFDPLTCSATSGHGEQCAPLWPGIQCQFGQCPDQMSMPDAGLRPDAGTKKPPSSPCGCGISMGLVIFALPWRRRRRR